MDIQEDYIHAWLFAAKAHSGQLMPGKELPYIVHIGMVANEIVCADRREPIANLSLAIQVALLHDVVEDTTVASDKIRTIFGDAVANGVEALSKPKKMPKEEAMAISIKEIINQPKEIGMVKLADRITNLRTPPAHWNNHKIAAYHKEAIFIYDSLKHVHTFLAARLAQKILEYERYFEIIP